jgi:hypothetical protein
VSRLYDRVMANGCRPFRIDVLVPTHVIAEERGPPTGNVEIPVAEQSYTADDLGGIPVILLDDAAEYVAQLTVDETTRQLKKPTNAALEGFFGVIRPPFDRCFLEFPLRRWSRVPGVRAGWLAEVEEVEGTAMFAEARWLLSLTLVMEVWRKGEVYGPCMTHIFQLDAHGEPCRREGRTTGVVEKVPPMTPTLGEGEDSYLRGVTMNLGFPAAFGLSLLNCKNVDMRAVHPPEKLAKRAQRKRGRPLAIYYVLDINPMRRILDTEGEAQTKGLGHAMHICRGHFKTYTEEAPLFGKRTGTYWWESQVRGKAEHGVVEKDYRIRLDQGLGREYVEADEHAEIAPSAPEHVGLDPDLGGRGVRAHNVTQNLLAEAVRSAGHEPRRPKPDEPQYDLAWEAGDETWVAEVKSITPQNEERQLRTALGQVLRYCQLLEEEGRTVKPMIATEVTPTDPSWIDLCAREGIVLVWGPDNLIVG